MNFLKIIENQILIGALAAWGLAQLLKAPMEYLRTGKWNWAAMANAGGMPSSHSALVVGATHGVGLYEGFDSPLFALAFAFTMIVVYDAANVRHQAGIQAQKINVIVNELLAGHPISEKDLREVLGHTWLEVIGGILLGLVVATICWLMIR